MTEIAKARALLGMPFPDETELPSVQQIDQARRVELCQRILDGLQAATDLANDYERNGYCTHASALRASVAACAILKQHAASTIRSSNEKPARFPSSHNAKESP